MTIKLPKNIYCVHYNLILTDPFLQACTLPSGIYLQNPKKKKMSDTTDSSNGSVIFVAEQKNIHVEVHPTPQSNQYSSETKTNSSFVPQTQPTEIQTSIANSSHPEVLVIPETGKYSFTFIKLYKKKHLKLCKCSPEIHKTHIHLVNTKNRLKRCLRRKKRYLRTFMSSLRTNP